MTQATDSEIREIRDLILGLDKKIDSLDKRFEVSQTRTDERFNSIDERFNSIDERFNSIDERFSALNTQLSDFKKTTDTQLADIRTQLRSQDNRLWTFVTALVLALVGLLSKLAFFPGDTP
ncbi:hypothetical protein GS597_07480 [Synechococcales cyanobacterium C]|uniref:WIT1/2 N-terminal helical bundle domain-containing protein n=1 Tax=Petrachloros mirabilis ULC683 TaxID=2781853 RepID=A0A8K1ZYM6_9CYAN|nr:hypothetical protein [Petrachloros mirabilis]NCJ06353.1 hypothetical protein [Petrachloros mirabilis ULC683]